MKLAFSPDSSQLLASCLTLHSPEVWLIPIPMGSGKPRRLFESLLAGVLEPPSFSWMPDNRHRRRRDAVTKKLRLRVMDGRFESRLA
jgi:hypothetical protein